MTHKDTSSERGQQQKSRTLAGTDKWGIKTAGEKCHPTAVLESRAAGVALPMPEAGGYNQPAFPALGPGPHAGPISH